MRSPGPASLLNEPFDIAFPKSFGPGIGDMVASISDSLGTRAVLSVEGDGRLLRPVDEADVERGHWSKS